MDSSSWQSILVVGLIALAGAWWVHRLWTQLRASYRTEDNHCGGCHGCAAPSDRVHGCLTRPISRNLETSIDGIQPVIVGSEFLSVSEFEKSVCKSELSNSRPGPVEENE